MRKRALVWSQKQKIKEGGEEKKKKKRVPTWYKASSEKTPIKIQ